MMCCWIVVGAAAAVDGGEKAGASAGTVKSRTFNVLNYGAVGDDKTDNTAAFSACLTAVIKALIVIVQTGEMSDHPVNKTKIAQCEAAIKAIEAATEHPPLRSATSATK